MLHWEGPNNPLWKDEEEVSPSLASEIISWGLALLALLVLWTAWGILIS